MCKPRLSVSESVSFLRHATLFSSVSPLSTFLSVYDLVKYPEVGRMSLFSFMPHDCGLEGESSMAEFSEANMSLTFKKLSTVLHTINSLCTDFTAMSF